MSEETNEELVLDEVVEVAPDDLSEEQSKYLQENADDLTDEQKETFKETLEKKEEEEEEEDVEPRTRFKPKKPKEGEEEEDVDDEDEKLIGKVVDQRLKQAGVGDVKDQSEVDAYIRENPEYSKYRANALKYMKAHPTLVAEDAVLIVSGTDQQKIGAKKERDAVKKTKETKSGGSSARKPKGGGKDWGEATPAEMAAKKAEIHNRRE